jgi:hypothetical protein
MPGRQPRIYECEVLSVSAGDRVITARSFVSGARFSGVSYILPYINSLGSGLDVVPRSGDRCLILATDPQGLSKGRYAVCIGFQTGFSPGIGGRRADLTEGSVCLRSVDEEGNDAHVICYAGGTLVIGSGQSARTVYSPINSTIAHLFDNYESRGSGGHFLWNRESGTDQVRLDVEYRTRATPSDTGMRIRVKLGVDPENPVLIEMVNEESGDAETPPFRLRLSADGQAWLEGESINIIGRAGVTIDAPTVNIKGKPVLGEKDPI